MLYFCKLFIILFIDIAAFVGFIYLVFKGYDFYIVKREIWSRRGIGTFTSQQDWMNKVLKICCCWAINAPEVPVKDNSNFVLLGKLTGKHTKSELQAWQKGALLLGIAEYLKRVPDNHEVISAANRAVQSVFNKYYDWSEEPKYVDYAFLAYSIMRLPQHNNYQLQKAMEKVIDVILEHTGDDKTVFYRKHIPRYRLVDTIGMVCPFLIRAGNIYGRPDLIELSVRQINEFVKYGIHERTHIPVHAYHEDLKVPLGIYGWGRGVGWYALGLIGSYEELQQEHPGKEVLKSYIVSLSYGIVQFQRSDGGWGHPFFLEQNTYDSSATAVLVYFLKKALLYKLVIGSSFIEAIEKGIFKLKLSSRRNGIVDFSQGDTKDIGVYSIQYREFPFTQGMVLGAQSIG